ncbi:MAG: response regulator transcription factor [Alphaproteobacteria bacterium]|nr:response regulator transcription factor [Alphaproteobacteria bacterium]MBV9692991.1 response regulator transcription factor [Alphaproteobacteria bacterium]
MAARAKILVVDDEPQIRRLLRTGLPPHGYDVVEAATAAEALKHVPREKPDALILDLGLPDKDGFAIIAKVRALGLTPILVLSARSDVDGKVRALELGADDYVTKPFDMAELLARLKAALRHGLQSAGEMPVFKSGPLRVDLVKRHVWMGETEIHLSPKEYNLLRLLVANAGKVLTHHQLLREVWGPAHLEDVQYLRVLMRQLRQKLETNASAELLITEPGVGYRLLMLA